MRLAKEFEAMIKMDDRFEIPAARHLGMVVFRLKGPNDLTEALLKKINTSGKLHCVPAALKVSPSSFRDDQSFQCGISHVKGQLRHSLHCYFIAHEIVGYSTWLGDYPVDRCYRNRRLLCEPCYQHGGWRSTGRKWAFIRPRNWGRSIGWCSSFQNYQDTIGR